MYAKTATVACLVLIAALSGCLGGGKPASTDDASPTTSATNSGSPGTSSAPPTTSPPPVAAAPVANLTADLENGTVPLLVNFTLADAANSTLAYEWTLDFGDGNETAGTTLPAVVNHTFESVGNYTVNFTISSEDGDSLASLVIVAELGRVVLQHVAGTWELGATGCLSSYDVWESGTALNGLTVVEFAVVASSIGKSYKASFTTDPEVIFVAVDFYDAAGDLVSGASDDDGTVDGTVPAGAALGLLHACNSGAGSVVYDAGINL